jgi:hypothetical protein
MPCCRKIDRDEPLLTTAIPYWNRSAPQIWLRSPQDVVVSIDEVVGQRQHIEPTGQCSVHIACQRNTPLNVLSFLVKTSNSLLKQADDHGNLPIMIGKNSKNLDEGDLVIAFISSKLTASIACFSY